MESAEKSNAAYAMLPELSTIGITGVHTLTIDEGAARALNHDGRSLLPTGICSIDGIFQRGDTVMIRSSDHKELARGIVRYPSQDLDLIKGRQSDEIAGILGYYYGAVAVHRNDLILVSYPSGGK